MKVSSFVSGNFSPESQSFVSDYHYRPITLSRWKINDWLLEGTSRYNSVLFRPSSLLKLSSSQLLRGDVGIHGNCPRSSGVRSGDAGIFAISMPSSMEATSIDERGVRLSGLKRLLLFGAEVEISVDVSSAGGGARGSVGGKML